MRLIGFIRIKIPIHETRIRLRGTTPRFLGYLP